MRIATGPSQPAPSGNRLEAYEPSSGLSWRMWSGLLIAAAVHVSFLLVAYLRPVPPAKRKLAPILMEVVVKKPTPPPEPVVPPPVVPPPVSPPPPVVPPPPSSNRPLPKELQPVVRENRTSDPAGPAISVPVQPPVPPGPSEPTGLPKGPINLFPKSLAVVMGAPGLNGAVPKAPDRMLKDDRLEEKKGPEFELIPEKGGGYKFDGKNFIAHIKPDGALDFENRFPIGFQKGGTFTFDATDLVMRSKKQDPYAAEKRRFIEFSDKVRTELREKALKEQRETALATLQQQLQDVWNSGRSGAARRRDIYEKWQDCSDDKAEALSRKGRRIIEDFVRTYLPSGSPEAYTAEELQKINAERQGLPSFDPYRSSGR